MTIQEIFSKAENGTLTYEQFETLAKSEKANFTDLSEGKYVSKNKYDSDLSSKDSQIDTLNTTIGTRDKDLETLKTQLAEAGTNADKLAALNNDFTALQGKYEDEVKNYKQQLKQQAYDFAVSAYVDKLKFTSEAAKRDFKRELTSAQLKMEKDQILGADDFKKSYEANNSDAFKIEEAPKVEEKPKPSFAGPTAGEPQVTKPSLSELMKAKNENPDMTVDF